ncbi:unnamed protein product [Adineta steineri]|uniref:Uncharacterized protein n=1 Tax=Adineta steineri TaxID=433720 RepID=A0A813P3F1_9BILA|nr:unnamed protein product [Adineta steineri]
MYDIVYIYVEYKFASTTPVTTAILELRTLGKKLVLEDINGNALFKIHQNGIRFLDQFNILSALILSIQFMVNIK